MQLLISHSTASIENLLKDEETTLSIEIAIGIDDLVSHRRIGANTFLLEAGVGYCIKSTEDSRHFSQYTSFVDSDDVVALTYGRRIYANGSAEVHFEVSQFTEGGSRVRGIMSIEDYICMQKTDWMIKEEIDKELSVSPFVHDDVITVTVTDGVAKLDGIVYTCLEFDIAAKKAIEGGAKWVISELRARYSPVYFMSF
jgi:osmotically-inducible protein OsmY